MNARFVDPTVSASREIPPAPRPPDLSGKVIGLLDNTKEQADVILETIGEALCARFGAVKLVTRRTEHYSKPATAEVLEEMAGECDVVVCALGG